MPRLDSDRIAYLRSLSTEEREQFLVWCAIDADPQDVAALRAEIMSATDENYGGRDLDAVCDFFGVSTHTVHTSWIKNGMPYGKKRLANVYDLREIARWIVGRRSLTDGNDEARDLEMQRKRDDQRWSELRRQKEEGLLIDAKLVREQAGAFSVRMRKMVEDVHRVIGPEGVEALNRIADALIEEFGAVQELTAPRKRKSSAKPAAKAPSKPKRSRK